jgi:hypothetical protein
MEERVIEARRADLRQLFKNWWLHCGIFILACAVVIARRPGSVLSAQFYAEDGRVFFQQAYNEGWWSVLFRPYGGYFQVVPRLGGALALLVKLSFAPIVLNIVAIAGQALPVNLLASSRSAAWGDLRYRSFLAAIYLVLPNLSELGTNITNVQCFLALCAFLLVVGSRPRTILGRTFDLLFLPLFGLSGPYCIFLSPIAIFESWRHHDRWKRMQASVLAVTAVIEAWSLLILDYGGRTHYGHGNTSPEWLIRILGGQIYLGVLIGTNILAAIRGSRVFLFLLIVTVCCSGIVAFCAAKAPTPMKLFLLFSSIVLAAALISPMLLTRPGYSLWEVMAEAWGSHYWFFPNLAFAWTLVWWFRARPGVLRVASGALLFFMATAICRNFREPALTDMKFQEYVSQFEAAPPGKEVRISINPANWSMELIKH